MDAILRRIFEIEEKAQHVVEDVKKEAADFDLEIEQVTARIQKRINAKVEEKIDLIKKIETEQMEKNIALYKEHLDESMDRINKTYTENKDQWVMDSYKMVLDGRRGNA